jgi:hypothetical protein
VRMLSLLSAVRDVCIDVEAAAGPASAPSPLSPPTDVCRRNHHNRPACNSGHQVKRLHVSGTVHLACLSFQLRRKSTE